MRRFLTALALVLGLASPASAQTHVPTLVTDSVRAQLARAWSETDTSQLERAYCLTAQWFVYSDSATKQEDTLALVVTEARPAKMIAATSYHSNYICPNTASASLHTHPPVTCDRTLKHCRIGGTDAYQCFPSTEDQTNLDAVGDLVGFIQCDRHAVVAFWRSPAPPPAPPPPSIPPAP